MRTRNLITGVVIAVSLFVAAAIFPFVLDASRDRIEADLARIGQMRVASANLQMATIRLMTVIDPQPAAHAAWSERMREADTLIGETLKNAELPYVTSEMLAELNELWEKRRRASVETVDLIDASHSPDPASPGSAVNVIRGSSLRQLKASFDELENANDAFHNRLAEVGSVLSIRLEPYEEVSFWFLLLSSLGLLGAAIALPVHVRKLRRRSRADASAIKEAELAARASERDLLITLNSIGDAVIAIDAQGRVRRLNVVAEHLTGWNQGEALGRLSSDILALIDVATGSPADDAVPQVLQTGLPVVRAANLELVRADGSRRQVTENAAPIRDESGRIHGVVIVLQDTTIQRALEARLRDVQRMESIGRLAGGVAHEFNNLLQIISGNAALLRASLSPSPEVSDHLERIDLSVRRAASLTNQLLAFGGRQMLVLKVTDVAALIARAIEIARRIVPPEIVLDYVEPAHGATARVDAGQIEQVIVNLCLRAHGAMPEGGRVRIELDEIETGAAPLPEDPGQAGPGRRHVRIRVTDSGEALSDEARQRIFEPFFSSSGSVLGGRLELAAVHGIVQQHGGYVEVDSVADRGTTFTVCLPAATFSPPSRPRAAAPHAPGRPGKILIAEDEPGVRLLAETVLARHGFNPVAASDGAEACRAFDAHAGDFQAALLDVIMPHMGGVEVARHLRNANLRLPIIFCTGFADGVLSELQLPRPWKILHKPYNVEELLDTVRQCLATGETPTPP